jgi:hypothetical protein
MGPEVVRCGTPDFTTYEQERVPELRTEDCVLVR